MVKKTYLLKFLAIPVKQSRFLKICPLLLDHYQSKIIYLQDTISKLLISNWQPTNNQLRNDFSIGASKYQYYRNRVRGAGSLAS